ncbi:MAG TPA: glycerol-3-phosphate 1-O-acyltransferase PlsY [Candidatus Eremiobacteraceae bacterium]|nr:glycerol-3-phosphate 1-O-acyltransferase PlsY [Candidatus Eremiobacteraceae bacterium]
MPRSAAFILLLVLGAYLLGSIPFGLIFAKIFGGKDVRQHGSGNIGATNVSRVAGPVAGVLTLLFDTGKGAVAVLIAARGAEHEASAMIFAGIGALLGHCFPVWLKFKGGKGVATALGMYVALCPLATLAAVVVFLLVVAFWRYISLGSLSAAAAMPLLVYFLWAPGHAPPLVVTLGTLFAAALLFYKHDANLQRLLDGTEPKFSWSKSKGEE